MTRVVGDEGDVAHRHQLRAAGQAVAVDLGDHRLEQVPDRQPVAQAAAGELVGPAVEQLRARRTRPAGRVPAGGVMS